MSGLVTGMPEAAYHAHPALSVSGAKKLLPPYCPAIYKYERDNGQPPKAAFDFGHAAHSLVLGVGEPVVVVDAPNWMTKAAKEQRDVARAAGQVPVLAAEWKQIEGMAAAIKAHPIASALLDPQHGTPEVSLFWDDEQHGIQRRGRLDWLPDATDGRRLVADFKTCGSAEPGAIRKAVANYGYHQQAAWYLDGLEALDLGDAAFLFIFQEKTAPYLVTVVELDPEALAIGRGLNDRAMQVFAECTATDTWPSYTSDVELISLPGWATREYAA